MSGPSRYSFDETDQAILAKAAKPRNYAAAVVALLLGLIAGAGAAAGAFQYGSLLFLAVPFCVGLGAAWIPAGPRPSLAACVGSAFQVNILLSVLFLFLGIEGVICMVMAAPLIVVLGSVGGIAGALLRRQWPQPPMTINLLLIMVMPLLLAWDRPAIDPSQPIAVTTEVIVAADPEAVWRETIAFTPITAPPTGLLRFGIAYPTHAVLREVDGRMIRECHFTTGAFIEPVTAWEPPNRLAFDVAVQPPSMRELSPWNIHPPHVDMLVQSQRGEFRIERLADGRTRLQGTTWYVITAAPAAYWQLWTDAIIHRIHRRVLDHIAERAEVAPLP